MPDNRKEYTELQKKIKSLRLRIAELEKDELRHSRVGAPPKSDLLYQTLIENIHLGITLIDTDYRIITTNVGMGKFFRKPQSEFVGKYCFGEFEKRNAICSHCPGTRTIATGRPAEVQTEGVRDDGSRISVHLRTFPVFEADGSIKGFVEVVEDLSGHKRAEKALRDSEELYRTLVENIGLGINLIDTNYRIIMTNTTHARLMKKPLSKFVGNYCFKEFEKRDTVCPHCPGKKAMATGRPAEVRTEGIGDDGSHLPIQIHAFPVFEADGSIKGFIEVIEDITEQKQAEEKLRESEERYREIVEETPDVIYTLDAAGNVTSINKAGRATFGRKREEVIGRNFTEWIPKEEQPAAVTTFKQILGGEKITDETILIDKDGNPRNVEYSSTPIMKAGKAVGTRGILRDITEHRQAEENLKESEQRFKAIFDNAADGILLADVESKKFYLGNKEICKMLGYKLEEIKNMTIWDIHPKEQISFVSRDFEKRARKEVVLAEDIPIKRKDGSVFYVDLNTFPITLGGKTYLTGIFRDITARKKAEEALRESEERFRSLAETTSDWIWEVDTNGIYTYVSPKVKDLLGYEPDEVVGKTPFDLMVPNEAKNVSERFRAIVESRRPFTGLENTNLHKDGRYVVLETSGVPVFDPSGNLLGYRGIDRDITERRKAEEELNIYREKMAQAERLASLGTLSATIAHELNQPLTVIRLSIENSLDDLKSASCPKEVLDTLRDGLNEVSNAASIVDRFRNYARQSSRKNLCETDLGAVAGRIIQLLGKTAQRANMTLNLKGMDNLPPVHSNEKDIEQLFFALTENAIQAVDGKKSHRFTIAGVVKDKNIELRFADNCSGIAPENLDKIFDPFFTTGSDDGRTGLGLPIVQRIVSGYEGKIRVQSQPGKGTTFYVTLPIHSEIVK